MDQSPILLRLQDIFRTVFKNTSMQINQETSMDNLEDWDSLSHVVLIDSIEKQFEVKFELRDMLDIESVADIVRLIEKKKQDS